MERLVQHGHLVWPFSALKCRRSLSATEVPGHGAWQLQQSEAPVGVVQEVYLESEAPLRLQSPCGYFVEVWPSTAGQMASCGRCHVLQRLGKQSIVSRSLVSFRPPLGPWFAPNPAAAIALRNETVQALKNVLSAIYPDQAVRRGRSSPATATGTGDATESPESVPAPSSAPEEPTPTEETTGETPAENPIPDSETPVPDDGETGVDHEPAAEVAEEVFESSSGEAVNPDHAEAGDVEDAEGSTGDIVDKVTIYWTRGECGVERKAYTADDGTHFKKSEAADLDAQTSYSTSPELEANIMLQYHWERASLIDMCARRVEVALLATPDNQDDDDMDAHAGGPVDVE
eukprot:s2440_g7.t1